MSLSVDTYEVTSKYYDQAYSATADLIDLPFYLGLAKDSRGPILEIACGTGRILLPIAREGIQIHGVDNSKPMLRILRAYLETEPAQVRERVTLTEGDMRTFRLDKKFQLVIIPFRPMQHMYTTEDQVNALKTAAFHLNETGILAFDVFYPKFDALHARIGEEVPDLEWSLDAEPGKTVRRYFRKESVYKINQNFSGRFIYRTYEGGRVVAEETEPLKLCYYTYPHLKTLFLLSGLKVVAEYGSFAKAPLNNDTTDMIFLLKKSM